MYPKELMTNVYWGFYGGKYESLTKFVQAVNEYHRKLGKEWNPDETVLACTKITVQYSFWDEEEEEEMEEDFNLIADSYSGFSAGDLLYKIHNQVVEKLEDDDHHFFEGLTLWEGENYNDPNVPLYFLNQGS
ncbi:MAG: hypothetical protein LBE91_00705 [Tannerella sp.]|jgi:hypothetical protein|nr:hypothetical protein [Tannerella sp.]